MRRTLSVTTLLAFSLACNETESGADTGTNSEDAVEESDNLRMRVNVCPDVDGSPEPLEGAVITVGEISNTVQGAAVPFDVPKESLVEMHTAKEGYVDRHDHLLTGDDEFDTKVELTPWEDLLSFYQDLDTEFDTGKAHVVVTVVQLQNGVDEIGVPDATITIDVDDERPCVLDPSGRCVEGNVTGNTPDTFVTFLNADAGPLTPVVETVEPMDCSVFPGTAQQVTFDAKAGTVNHIKFVCRSGS